MHDIYLKQYEKQLEDLFERAFNQRKDLFLSIVISLVFHSIVLYYLYSLILLNFGSIEAMLLQTLQTIHAHDLVIIFDKTGMHISQ